MDRPPPDPGKLLEEWMEWERGEATPGRVMANLKTKGLRDLLEALVEAQAQAEALAAAPSGPEAPVAEAPAAAAAESESEPEAASAWTPTV